MDAAKDSVQDVCYEDLETIGAAKTEENETFPQDPHVSVPLTNYPVGVDSESYHNS